MAEAENKGLLALVGAALLGIGGYLWLKGTPSEPQPLGDAEFGPLKFVAAMVGSKVKNPGDTWSGTISFPHRGRGTTVVALLNVTPPGLFTLWGELNPEAGGVPDVDFLRRYALGDAMAGGKQIPDEVNWTTHSLTIGPFSGLLIPSTSETYLGVLVVLTDTVSGKVVQYAWFNNVYQVLQAPEFGDVTATFS